MSRNLGPTDLKRLNRGWRRRTTGTLSLLLDGVQNPFNLGSITRSAAALGVDRVWLVGSDTGLRSPKVQKTALGTDRYVDWQVCERLDDALADARGRSLRLVGLELSDTARPLFEIDLTGNICLVVGHEDRGLTPAAAAACTEVGYVPLVGRVGSLNVSQAVSVALYEVRRQEWTSAGAT